MEWVYLSGVAKRITPTSGQNAHYHHHHQTLNRESRWGTTDHFVTSFLHFSLFSSALWDLPNSRPVHSLMLSSRLFFCLPCLLPPFTVPCKMVLARPDERETWPYHCSLRLFTTVRVYIYIYNTGKTTPHCPHSRHAALTLSLSSEFLTLADLSQIFAKEMFNFPHNVRTLEDRDCDLVFLFVWMVSFGELDTQTLTIRQEGWCVGCGVGPGGGG